MGKRGPAPKPTALKLIEGTARKDRANPNEPIAPAKAKTPQPASWLSADAKAVWRKLAPSLHERGVLTDWDLDAFGVLCNAIAEHRQAAELVAGSSVIVRGGHGELVKNPALQIVRDTAQTIRAYCQEFGLTPSARAGITALDTGQLDDGILD